MKITHISTLDHFGAGNAALKIHTALLEQGVDSRMLVANKTSDVPFVYEVKECSLHRFKYSSNPFIKRIQSFLHKRGWKKQPIEKYRQEYNHLQSLYPCTFSFPITDYDLSQHPLIQDADIIQLHWVGNFLDFPTFFQRVQKPIVWTMHDQNPFMGGFHLQQDNTRFYHCYKHIEDVFLQIKQNGISQAYRMYLVAISDEMKSLMINNYCYSLLPIVRIPNCVNCSMFIKLNRTQLRKEIGINTKRLLLFISLEIDNPNKGLRETLLALKQLREKDFTLLCVGNGKIPRIEIDFPIIQYPATNDPKQLSSYYSVADLLIFPSKQEAFAQTPIESLCCGTPVVMTPVSGAKEQINEFNGIICDDFSIESIVCSVEKALCTRYDRDAISEDIINRFNPHKIASQYIELYNSIPH